MTQAKDNILPSSEEMEEIKMAEIPCAWCGLVRQLVHSQEYPGNITRDSTSKDYIRGVITCGGCNGQSIFALRGNVIDFLPGKLFEEDLRKDVAANALEMFHESLLCFYGGSNRGVVAFARSAVEEALDAKNVKGDNLFEKIPEAKKHGILGDAEVTQAHNARLVGKLTLHRMMKVTPAEAIGALVATVSLVNHIAEQDAVPASQSGTDSNGA